jgi:hypothetical protein
LIRTVHHGHGDVHEDDVRHQVPRHLQRLSPVASLPDQPQVVLPGQELGHALAEERVVVDQEHANEAHLTHAKTSVVMLGSVVERVHRPNGARAGP